MDLLAPILCLLVAAGALLRGFVGEYARSGRVEPHELVPSLPWALVSAAFVLLALWTLPLGSWR